MWISVGQKTEEQLRARVTFTRTHSFRTRAFATLSYTYVRINHRSDTFIFEEPSITAALCE